jgi:ribonuclease P/MRP protein subunit RPP1
MKFSDLHLRVPLADLEQTKKMFAKSSELGYNQIGVPFPPNIKQDTINRLRQAAEEFSLDFVTRLNLEPKSSNELLSGLRRFRRMFEVIAVVCNSKNMARLAAKDTRVDLLCFRTFDPKKRFFDRAEAELASKSSASFEIDMAAILGSEGFVRIRFLSCLRREVETARKFNVPVVISSGAADALFLRKPQDYASLAFLFSMDLSPHMEAFSKNPIGLVERNRKKQSAEYVAPGIRIVKEKKLIG